MLGPDMQQCSPDVLCGAILLLDCLVTVDTLLYLFFFLCGGLSMNQKDQCRYAAVRALVTIHLMSWQIKTTCDIIFSIFFLILSVLHGVVFFRFLARMARILNI